MTVERTGIIAQREPVIGTAKGHAYDVIVIGSGLGGLTCGALLARAGMKILVLEQHYTAGGYAHSFRRGKFLFDSAVHYTGECHADGLLTRILELLGVADRVAFAQMDPAGFDHLHFPDFTFRVPSPMAAYRERLKAQFPSEARGIDRFCDVMEGIWSQLRRYDIPRHMLDLAALPLRFPFTVRWSFATVKDLLDATTQVPELRAVLAAERADYGEPPSRASVLIHSGVMGSYLQGGAYYPRGGTQAVVNAMVHALQTRGGELRLRTAAKRVVMGRDGVSGVELDDGERIEARLVVSNADLWRTFGELVGFDNVPRRFAKKVQRRQPSTGAFSLFLGVDLDLEALGFGSENHWFFTDYEVENGIWDEVSGERPTAFLVSSPSLKDPGHGAPERHHTLQVVGLMQHGPFSQWAERPVMQRGESYEALKQRLAGKIIQELEARFIPDLSQHIKVLEIGTPVTNAYYGATTAGACYGPALIPTQVGLFTLGPKTPIPGLWLAGANGGTFFGMVGSMLGGVHTAAALLKRRASQMLWG